MEITERPNRLRRRLAALEALPGFLRKALRNRLLGRAIPFTGTAGIEFRELGEDRVTLHLANRRKVRNHIGGVHAAAVALLAETASGLALGMHIPDDKLPLLKSMTLRYVRRSSGGLVAIAQLTDSQIAELLDHERGDMNIAVEVRDAGNEETVVCEMIWAWVLRK